MAKKIDRDAVFGKIKSIHELVIRGEANEAENAKKLLKVYLKRYGLTLEEILEGEESKIQWITISSTIHQKLFHQICFSMGFRTGKSTMKGRRSKRYVECKDSEFIEVRVAFDHYKKLLKQELEVFFTAFILRQKLYSGNSDNNRKLTDEEIERMMRASKMMNGIIEEGYHKRIGNDDKHVE